MNHKNASVSTYCVICCVKEHVAAVKQRLDDAVQQNTDVITES